MKRSTALRPIENRRQLESRADAGRGKGASEPQRGTKVGGVAMRGAAKQGGTAGLPGAVSSLARGRGFFVSGPASPLTSRPDGPPAPRRRKHRERSSRVTAPTDLTPRTAATSLPLAEVAIRRSELTVPGHLLDLLRKAAASQADEVMLDCEDACPVSAKGDEVRRKIVEALTTFDWGGKALFVRPNGRRTVYGADDLAHIVTHAVDRFHGVIR